MTIPPTSSRLEVAHRLAAHLGHRDFDQFSQLLSPDVTYQVQGTHALAGTFHGRDQVITHVRQLVDRTDDTYDTVKWDDWLVGEEHVAALVQIRIQGHGAVYEGRVVLLFAFNTTDQVCGITVFFDDSAAATRFFGQEPIDG